MHGHGMLNMYLVLQNCLRASLSESSARQVQADLFVQAIGNKTSIMQHTHLDEQQHDERIVLVLLLSSSATARCR
jgi:hypothetical protein